MSIQGDVSIYDNDDGAAQDARQMVGMSTISMMTDGDINYDGDGDDDDGGKADLYTTTMTPGLLTDYNTMEHKLA